MSSKVSITMSDELYSRLDRVRDKFNISEICREALEKEVKIEELAMNSGNDEAIIERLKLQKTKLEMDSRQDGRKDGIDHAKWMSYLQLLAFAHFKDNFFYEKDDDYGEEFTVPELISQIALDPKMLRRESNQYTLDEYFSDVSVEAPKVNVRKYFIGFVEGVVSFYDGVKGKIGV